VSPILPPPSHEPNVATLPLPLAAIRYHSNSPRCRVSYLNDSRATPPPLPPARVCLTELQWQERLAHLESPSAQPPGSQLLWTFRSPLERTRLHLSTLLSKSDQLGLWREILLGEVGDRSRPEILRAFGFVHIGTTTGIHLLALQKILQFFIPTLWTGPLGLVLTLLLCATLWLLAGAKFGMLRAVGILCLRETARLLGFRWTWYSPLLIALTLEAIYLTLWGIPSGQNARGRLIYALAVGGSLMALEAYGDFSPFTSRLKRREAQPLRSPPLMRSSLPSHLAMALGSWLTTSLFEAFHTHTLCLLTPLLNLITLPIFILALYPVLVVLLLSSCLPFPAVASVARPLMDFWISFGNHLIQTSYQWTAKGQLLWLISPLDALSWAHLAVAGFSLLSWMLLRTRNLRALILLTLTLAGTARVLFSKFPVDLSQVGLLKARMPDSPKLKQIDVGQGDSAWVVTPDLKLGWIDFGSCTRTSELRWLTELALTGQDRVAWGWVSHSDEDHMGGLSRALHVFNFDCLSIPPPQLSQLNTFTELNWKKPVDCVPHATTWSQMPKKKSRTKANLHPTKRKRLRPPPNSEMGALFLPLDEKTAFLSLGDMTSKDEKMLLPWIQSQLSGTFRHTRLILKLSHHGAHTSSSREFLQALPISEAWISAGATNRYGHPSPQVLHHLHGLGIPWKLTADQGSLNWP
jgi:competence protein ComEC